MDIEGINKFMQAHVDKMCFYKNKDIPIDVQGVLIKAVGMTLEGRGLSVAIGTICEIITSSGMIVEAIVTGFGKTHFYLVPVQATDGLEVGNTIKIKSSYMQIPVGDSLLGRIINGYAKPLDGNPCLGCNQYKRLNAKPLNPLTRQVINKPLDLGVQSINALLTVGRGQRIGLFAGSGVGKSVLLGMIARFASADVIVVGLIGERGREVKEFIEDNLGKVGLQRSVVVACPADDSPILRMQGANVTMTIAEYFRDQGKHVLLLMDSLTRYAQAQREIALSMGEPPATKGYPPSVFAELPRLVERAGMGGDNGGSITGIFTVLAEGDDQNDPIVDAARAILDGHIVLTRTLADKGHYPAIDIAASVSRVMKHVINKEHWVASRAFKRYLSLYEDSKDLINIGAYVVGNDIELDFAVEKHKDMVAFLQQDIDDNIKLEKSLQSLYPLLERKEIVVSKHEKD